MTEPIYHWPTEERRLITKAITRYRLKWEIAKALGITDRTLYRKMKEYNLKFNKKKEPLNSK